jgi:hypothetical protein
MLKQNPIINPADSKKSIKQRQRAKRMGRMIAGALALETFGSVGLVGCDNLTNLPEPPKKPQSKECMCPDKIHGNAPCDCNAIECECEQKEWALKYNLTLINETGEKIGDTKGIVEEGLDLINSKNPTFSALMTDVAALNAKIIITSNGKWDRNGNSLTIGKQDLDEAGQTASMLSMAFKGMTKSYSQLSAAKQNVR